MTIRNVSDTARWVAYYRAMESERPDAIFRDPFARGLAGPEGETIVKELKQGRAIAPALIVRTRVFDDIILDRINHHGVTIVLNLAAGLDTRPWRLPLPATLQWIDVDLHEILQYKTDRMTGATPACHYEAVIVDLTNDQARDQLIDSVGAREGRVLVVTEGLLIYLEPAQVRALAHALHRPPSFAWWLTDLVTPRLLQMMTRSNGDKLQNAPFKFGPAEGSRFFAPEGWHEDVFRSAMEDARTLHREMRMAWLWRFMSHLMPGSRREEFRRMSGALLLRRA